MADDPIQFPSPGDLLSGGGLKKALLLFGPGAVMASVTIGSGETVFASRGGAVFGYAILWAFVLGIVMKGVANYAATRYLTLTGEHPIDRWAHFPGPRGWFPFFIGALSIACFPFWLSFLPSLLGTLCNWIFGFGDHRVWGTAFTIVVVTITLAGGYDVLEKAQQAIVGMLLASVLFSVFYFQPDWGAVLKGSLIPGIPEYEGWITDKYPDVSGRPVWIEVVVYIGAIGGGTYDSIGYVGLFREKSWGILAHSEFEKIQDRLYRLIQKGKRIPLARDAENVRRGLAWLKAPRTDAILSFGAVLLFSAGFMIGGARVLNPDQLIPSGLTLLEYQAQFLTEIRSWLFPVYAAGVFFAVFGTLYAAYEVYTRTAYECLRTVFHQLRETPMHTVRLWVVGYGAIGGLALMWLPVLFPGIELIDLPTPAGIVGGVLTLGLWALAMAWTDRTFLPDEYQMGSVLFWLTVTSGVAMTAMGLRAWWDYGTDTFGALGGWWAFAILLVAVLGSMGAVSLVNKSRPNSQSLDT